MLQLQHCAKKFSVDKLVKLFDGKFVNGWRLDM